MRDAIQQALGPDVQVIDTSAAVAAQVARVAASLPALPASASDCLLQTTGDAARLARFAAHWLPFAVRVEASPAGL